MDPLPNSYLGQYLLQEVIGRGGGAVVYKAFQHALGRQVAVKVLRGLSPEAISRFEREVQAIARLQHRNILPVYDFGQQGERRYFVMQYVEGGATLADTLARGPMEPVPALRLLCRLLDALAYAHQQGVIHRDIKPSNILLPSPDWPLLADFGIAKLLHAGQLTPPGMAIGTAAYMAPEAALQRPLDGRADLYSAGVVLYEMLTGRVPFDAPTPIATLGRHIGEPPPPPRSLAPELPPAAEAVTLRALAKDPADRYQSAGEMQGAIAAAIKQIERASAQIWLLGQLGQGGPAAHPARPGYTTRKLAAEEAAPSPAPAGDPHARRPPPRRPPAPARARASAPRPLAAALVGALLLAIGALAWGLRGAGADPAPAGPTVIAGAPAQADPPAAGSTPAPQATAPPAATAGPVAAGEGPPDLPREPPEERRAPTATAAPPTATGAQPTATAAAAGTILLDDGSWAGGYARSRGSNVYGGRTATWIYGVASDYSTMRASFEVPGQPAGEALLRIEGMDSEGPARTPIRIAVNGAEIYRGPNPLPDDDIPYESGTWASETWRFDGALLRPGANEITISNLAEGSFGGPPFFMLDYAELAYGGG